MVADLVVQEIATERSEINRQRESLRRDLQMLIELEPLEDGVSHPIEQRLKDELMNNPSGAPEVIQRLFDEWSERPSFAAALLRCLGRLHPAIVGEWGLGLASNALSHRDVEVRDAAVSALELWGGDGARRALQKYAEQEPVSWLARYMKQVVTDLSESSRRR
jgi:hypothetical protein